MGDIFISYKREDRDRVQPFAQALESEGFSIWWDPELPIGHSYSSSIRTQLNEAWAVIPVWTHLSVQSEWVQEEATQGKRRGVLFPIRLDAVDPPIGFTMVETADLSDWQADDRSHPEWSRLIEQLRAQLQRTVAADLTGWQRCGKTTASHAARAIEAAYALSQQEARSSWRFSRVGSWSSADATPCRSKAFQTPPVR